MDTTKPNSLQILESMYLSHVASRKHLLGDK